MIETKYTDWFVDLIEPKDTDEFIDLNKYDLKVDSEQTYVVSYRQAWTVNPECYDHDSTDAPKFEYFYGSMLMEASEGEEACRKVRDFLEADNDSNYEVYSVDMLDAITLAEYRDKCADCDYDISRTCVLADKECIK